MIYRQLDANGDMTFGHGLANFLANSPATVAQAVMTRLRLYSGEWFLDTQDGTPWRTKVLGVRTAGTRDVVLRARILGTPGVTAITSFTATVDPVSRRYTVQAGIDTVYGSAVASGVV